MARVRRLDVGATSITVSFVTSASAPVASAADVALELPLGRLGVNLADAPNGEVLVETLGDVAPPGRARSGRRAHSLNAASLAGRDAAGVASALGAAADSPRRLVVRRAHGSAPSEPASSATTSPSAVADTPESAAAAGDSSDDEAPLEISFMFGEPLGLEISPDDLTILSMVPGSQADCYGVPPRAKIVAVDGEAVTSYDDFLGRRQAKVDEGAPGFRLRFVRTQPRSPPRPCDEPVARGRPARAGSQAAFQAKPASRP